MSKKKVIAAMVEARNGNFERAKELLAAVPDRGFVRKRLRHYAQQPDHREAAFRLEEALNLSDSSTSQKMPARTTFSAPLPLLEGVPAPADVIEFSNPEPFLQWASADWSRAPPLFLDNLRYTDTWVMVALGALTLEERNRRPPLRLGGESTAARFAHAVGLGALTGGDEPRWSEPERTVKLTRVKTREQIEPIAEKMASLVFSNSDARDGHLALRYVLIELLRNVVQHSLDPLGGVAAAQRMDVGPHRNRPMIQLAVADAGIGIPRSLSKHHPHLVDYRQALERALLPHISGTFDEGLTGSFENAGLGLYMISEMARRTGGRMLIATTGAALVLQGGAESSPATPHFLHPLGVGFPGTLVAFELPTDAVEDYLTLNQQILRTAQERTPKRVSDRWLSFDPAPAESIRQSIIDAKENTGLAAEICSNIIRPAVLNRQPIDLDFTGLDLCTQSWLHALLYEPVRLAWAMRVAIHISNADPAVREGLRFLESYALGG